MGNPDSPTPRAHRRQAGRDGARRQDAPLLDVARHPGPAPGLGRLLRPPLRRAPRPRDPGLRDARAPRKVWPTSRRRSRRRATRSSSPNPSYPIHPYGFIIAGASIRHVPFGPGIDLMRELAHGRRALGAGADHGRAQLPVQPDRADLRSRLLPGGRGLGAAARHLAPVRHRLRRDLFRRPPPPSILEVAGRLRRRDRVRLAVQDLLHAGLADRLRRRQRAADRGARPGSSPTSTTAPSRRSRWPPPRR